MESTSPEPQVDQVYRHSLRESLVAVSAWLVCGVYSVTYCFLNGHGRKPDEIEVTWGIPNWVLFGVFLPWVLCNVFAWWYCFCFVKDQELDPEAPEDAGGDDAAP